MPSEPGREALRRRGRARKRRRTEVVRTPHCSNFSKEGVGALGVSMNSNSDSEPLVLCGFDMLPTDAPRGVCGRRSPASQTRVKGEETRPNKEGRREKNNVISLSTKYARGEEEKWARSLWSGVVCPCSPCMRRDLNLSRGSSGSSLAWGAQLGPLIGPSSPSPFRGRSEALGDPRLADDPDLDLAAHKGPATHEFVQILPDFQSRIP